MFLAIDYFLKKLGSAFGVIFKVLIPAVLYFFPFKILILGLAYLLLQLGVSTFLAKNIETVYIVLYIIFVMMLVFLPKVASAIEFVLTPLYLVAVEYVYTVLFKTHFYSLVFSRNIYDININRICVVALLIFIAFKIIFFIYIRNNIDKIYDMETEF